MRIRHPKDFYTGVMFFIFGALAMFFAEDYKIGTAANMGPGYFPFALGAFLALLGVLIVIRSLLWAKGPHATPAFQLRPLFLVLSSVVLFGLLLQPLGLLVSTTVLVVLSSRASHEFRWKEALLNATALIVIVLVVFVYFLDFQVPIWPSFLAGHA
jgi:predicted lysophospholipase L1 biosynthesis ABC-type transport system permease subunit